MELEKLKLEFIKHSVVSEDNHILSANGYDYHALITKEFVNVSTLHECNGVRFLCPQCLGQGHEHLITRWSHQRGVPFFASPVRYRWKITGTQLSDLCVTPDFENEMSIERDTEVCSWNGFILNGEVRS